MRAKKGKRLGMQHCNMQQHVMREWEIKRLISLISTARNLIIEVFWEDSIPWPMKFYICNNKYSYFFVKVVLNLHVLSTTPNLLTNIQAWPFDSDGLDLRNVNDSLHFHKPIEEIKLVKCEFCNCTLSFWKVWSLYNQRSLIHQCFSP